MNFLQIKYPKVDVQYNCGCGHQFMKCPERMHLRQVFLGQTNFCWSLSVFLSALSELFMKAKRKKTFFRGSLALSCQLPTGVDSKA